MVVDWVVPAHLSLATGEDDIDESSGVLVTLKSTTLGGLGLLLRLNLLMSKKKKRVSSSSLRCGPEDTIGQDEDGRRGARNGSYFGGLRLDLAYAKRKNKVSITSLVYHSVISNFKVVVQRTGTGERSVNFTHGDRLMWR